MKSEPTFNWPAGEALRAFSDNRERAFAQSSATVAGRVAPLPPREPAKEAA